MDNFTYAENEIIYLPVKKILPNPYQPRRIYDKQRLKQLTNSVKQYGIIQPILVRYINNKIYELVSGERRLKASILAGFDTIPAIIVYASDRETAVMGFTDNIQNEKLNYLEEAEGIRVLKYGFKYSIDEICHIINKDKDYIEQQLEFLNFSSSVKALLYENNVTRDSARALLDIEDENVQIEIIKKAVKYNISDKDFSDLVTTYIRQKKINNTIEVNHLKIRSKFKDFRLFTNTIKQALAIMKSAGMETGYEVCKNDDNYEIKINIKP